MCDTEDTKEETLKGRSTKIALQCVRFFEKEKGRSETAKKVRIQRRKLDVIDRGRCRRDYRPNRPNTLQDTQEKALEKVQVALQCAKLFEKEKRRSETAKKVRSPRLSSRK